MPRLANQESINAAVERMDDLQLDVPRALETFTEAYVKPAQELGLPASFVDKCVPMASVKDRIVSECAPPASLAAFACTDRRAPTSRLY